MFFPFFVNSIHSQFQDYHVFLNKDDITGSHIYYDTSKCHCRILDDAKGDAAVTESRYLSYLNQSLADQLA
jgi:hypothetical protein